MTLRLIGLAAASIATSAHVRGWSDATLDPLTTRTAGALLGEVVLTALALVLAWVTAAVGLDRLRRRAGVVGQVAGTAWRLLVPATVRVAATTALGVGGVTGLAGMSPVAALDASAPPDVAVPQLGRPVTSAPAPAPSPPPTRAAHAGVTVVPGDSLWRIAARHLGPTATPSDVAAHWPRWYEANRATIGPDPDLILVGTRLRPPSNQVVSR